jgi:hypothetical protein
MVQRALGPEGRSWGQHLRPRNRPHQWAAWDLGRRHAEPHWIRRCQSLALHPGGLLGSDTRKGATVKILNSHPGQASSGHTGYVPHRARSEPPRATNLAFHGPGGGGRALLLTRSPRRPSHPVLQPRPLTSGGSGSAETLPLHRGPQEALPTAARGTARRRNVPPLLSHPPAASATVPQSRRRLQRKEEA